MSEDTKFSWDNFLGKIAWSSPTSAYIQISIALLLFALLSKNIDINISKVLIYIWVTLTIAGIIKYQWIFFTGKTARDIIAPTLGSKDNPLLNAKDAEIVQPKQLTGKTVKSIKQKKATS